MTRPTLAIPIKRETGGGLYTFLDNFVAYLKAHEWPFTERLDDAYDVLFVNSWVVPYGVVRREKRRRPGLRVVQRVDGSAQDYGRGRASDAGQARVNLLADLTIFQSEYARFSVTEKFRVISGDGPTIHNPVDVQVFVPEGRRAVLAGGGPHVINVSWSTNQRKGTWRIQRLAERHPQLHFVLCGRYEPMPSAPNVTFLGHLDRVPLAEVLRAGDLYLDLTENDACPNVVLEALASGLPVAHVDSGGVSELAGDAGLSMNELGLAECVRRATADGRALGRAARLRALAEFAPDVVFPRYLNAIVDARRKPLPTTRQVIRASRAGFPVLPARLESLRGSGARSGRRRPAQNAVCRIGWITYDSFARAKREFSDLDSFTRMRAGITGEWLNAHDARFHNELYRSGRDYDVVVFQKVMDCRAQQLARQLQVAGTKVVFDANVNYYEIWGDYFIPGTEPTPEQQRDAIRMTRGADWVVADSTYIAAIARKFNPRVTWIPDCVSLTLYSGERQHEAHAPLRLIWSGQAKKGAHILEAAEALTSVPGLSLTLLSDDTPHAFSELERLLPCRYIPFSDDRYAQELLEADVIISPKRLVNGYEMGHTEYKIALGMAVGLPAVASPQPSYIDALADGGGIIARTADDWRDALTRLSQDVELRRSMGRRARDVVHARYSPPAVSPQYARMFERLLGID